MKEGYLEISRGGDNTTYLCLVTKKYYDDFMDAVTRLGWNNINDRSVTEEYMDKNVIFKSISFGENISWPFEDTKILGVYHV